MSFELVEADSAAMALYWHWTEGQHYVVKPEGATGGDCLTSLGNLSKNLRNIKAASSVAEQADSWRKKLEAKYVVSQNLDDDDKKDLSNASWEWHNKLLSVAQDLDKDQKTLESIEERVKRFEKSYEPLLENMKEFMTRVQTSTLNFVESSPTERSLEPILRGLLTNAGSAELMFAGYFDQYLLKDFQSLSSKPQIKFISPELTGSKQDQTNLDALKRLSAMGAEIRFHPMLHARMVLSPTEIIVGSADIKSDCLGGRRYDAGIWTNNPMLIRSGKTFFDKVWAESKKL